MRRQKPACRAVLFVLIMMLLGGCSSEKEPLVTEKPLETTVGTTAGEVPERAPDTVLIPPLPDCYTESEQASATLNGEKQIVSLLETLQTQSLPPSQILVVDSQSDDATVERAQSESIATTSSGFTRSHAAAASSADSIPV